MFCLSIEKKQYRYLKSAKNDDLYQDAGSALFLPNLAVMIKI